MVMSDWWNLENNQLETQLCQYIRNSSTPVCPRK